MVISPVISYILIDVPSLWTGASSLLNEYGALVTVYNVEVMPSS